MKQLTLEDVVGSFDYTATNTERYKLSPRIFPIEH